MKNFIITQAKDQSYRLKDWILYHIEEGFDTIIYFDDYSEDDSIDNLKNISAKYGVNIIINYSDNIGNKRTRQEMSNSQSYAGDVSVNYRIIRSYNRGLEIARSLNPDSICALIDVDEFITSDRGKATDSIRNLMSERNTKHLAIHSFDVYDDFEQKEWYSTDECTKFRWDFDYRKQTDFRQRVKSVCVASEIREIPLGPNLVHVLTEEVNNAQREVYFGRVEEDELYDRISVSDYESIRIHHYRKPCHDKKYLHVEDRSILDKMISIKEKYS